MRTSDGWKTEMDLGFVNHEDEGNEFGEEAFRPFRYRLMCQHSICTQTLYIQSPQTVGSKTFNLKLEV